MFLLWKTLGERGPLVEYLVIGDDEVLSTDGYRRVGMIRRRGRVWHYGTFNEDETIQSIGLRFALLSRLTTTLE